MNVKTGESVFLSVDEAFCLLRLTDGVDWARELRSIDFKALIFLANEMYKDGKFVMGQAMAKRMMAFLGVKKRAHYDTMRRLLSLDMIRETGRNSYMVNPRVFYKSRSQDFDRMAEVYDKLKKDGRGKKHDGELL